MLFTSVFQPTPDSALGMRRATSAAQGRPSSRIYPWLMLVWSIWIFITPLYEPQYFPDWLWPTLGSYAVFLVLFHRAYFHDRRWIPFLALGMAGLGYAVTPFNPGAQGYMVYACAFLGFGARGRVAVASMLGLLALYCLEWVWNGWPSLYLISAVVVSLAVGVMNIAQAQRECADAALRLEQDEVRRLAALAERERIGRDLHDLLGHTLSLVALKSELAGKLLARGDAPQAREAARREIDEVTRVARDALAQVRAAVTGIRATGIAAELASAKLMLESDGIAFASRIAAGCLEAGALPKTVEGPLALALRETVTNIQRHARARSVEAALTLERGEAVLSVRDDGRGGVETPGNGLTGMRERLEAVGGRLVIESARGAGTRIEARVPLVSPDVPAPMDAGSRASAS